MNDQEHSDLVKTVVRETLIEFGIEIDEPRKMQADLVFLRRQRIAQEAMGTRVKAGLALLVLGGIATAVIWALKQTVGLK